MTAPQSPYQSHIKELKDYYWAYADILRDIGINESTYDQRIMAFMALKLLIDNDKLRFNFEYRENFSLSEKEYKRYKDKNTKEIFLDIIKNIEKFGREENLHFFHQKSQYNPDKSKNILTYLNHYKTFELERYIIELSNSQLENVLDIYTYQANFRDYPKEEYKDLYEKTISRMKKMSGDLTGQHFTQKSIIHLMCEMGIQGIVDWKHNYDEIKENMESKKTNFFVVKDEKGKVVTPKKSDGQFLFMMHIINLMQRENKRGKRATAGIISSSTLISTGSATGSEAKIRRAIFKEKLVSAVLEQPSAMFTNTDITSHIWFLDTLPTAKIKVVKADTKEEELFVSHPNAKDKMKHAYSKENIKKLKRYLTNKGDKKYVSKSLSCDRCEINIGQEIGFKDDTEELSIDALIGELDVLMKDMCDDYQTNGLLGIR